MTKLEFLLSLRDRLSALPNGEVEERLRFYSEMIEDRVEDGLSEQEAVAAIGSVDEIAAQIIAEASSESFDVKSPGRRKAWKTVLLVAGAPVWIPLLAAALSVGLSLYASLWAVLIALWAVFVSLTACASGGTVAGIGFICGGYGLSGAAMLAAGCVCAGLAVFAFLGCRRAAEGVVRMTAKAVCGVKRRFAERRAFHA